MALLGVGVAMLVVLVAALGGASASLGAGPQTVSASADAKGDVPAAYLRMYESAAARYGIDWAILAAIGKVECDHGRDPDPSCTRQGVVNSAGAGGPMQFIASTWRAYGVDGDGDGRAVRWDPADAIPAAARYLRAAGAPGDNGRAIYAYNHASWYVARVEAIAAGYRGAAAGTGPGAAAGTGAADSGVTSEPAVTSERAVSATPIELIAGSVAELAPGDGHVARIPATAPAVVQAMLVAGNELQSLAYGPGGHPDPRGASEEDCSSTINYVLYRSGVRPIGEILSPRTTSAGARPGPGGG